MTNRYEKGEEIGLGGMATVYAGRDTVLGRAVAIKVPRLPTELEDADSEWLARFLDEARKLARVQHQFVLAIHDVVTEHEPPWMIMELAGATLAERLRLGPIRPLDQVQRQFEQLVSGLAAIHEQGLVHRDIKPLNILRCGAHYKIGDLGIAKQLGERTLPYFTQKYAAPEVHLRKSTDQAADVYSLGLVGYEMVLGTEAFDRACRDSLPLAARSGASDDGEVPWAVWHTHSDATLPALDRSGGLPQPLAAVMAKMIATRPEDRFPSCVEARAALVSAAAEDPGHTEPVPEPTPNHATEPVDDVDSEPVPEPPPSLPRKLSDGSRSAPTDRWPRRRGWWLAVAGVAIVIAVTAFAFIQRGGPDSDETALLRQRGLAAAADGRHAAAVTDLDAVLLQTPEDVEAGLACAKAHYQLTNYGQASALLDRMAVVHPDEPEVPLYRGLIDLARNRMKSAVAHLERAVALVGEGHDAGFYLGYALYKQGDYASARTVLERFLAMQQQTTPLTERARGFLENIRRRGIADTDSEPPSDRSIYEQRFTLEGFRQATTPLEGFRGAPLVLHLWASWCLPCQEEMPSLVKFFERAYEPLARAGLRLVTVSNDFTEPELARFVNGSLPPEACGLRIYWDPNARLSERLALGSALPQTLIVGRDGHVVERTVGVVDWQSQAFLHRLDDLVGSEL